MLCVHVYMCVHALTHVIIIGKMIYLTERENRGVWGTGRNDIYKILMYEILKIFLKKI